MSRCNSPGTAASQPILAAPGSPRKKRVPKLNDSTNRNIGRHEALRNPKASTPRRRRFGMISREDAEAAYYDWLAAHMRGETPKSKPNRTRNKLQESGAAPKARPQVDSPDVVSGSLLQIVSGFLTFEESRTSDDVARRKGTITKNTYGARKRFAHPFLEALHSRYGLGAVGRMRLADRTTDDVETFHQVLATAGCFSFQVRKRKLHVRRFGLVVARVSEGVTRLAGQQNALVALADVTARKAKWSRFIPCASSRRSALATAFAARIGSLGTSP